LVFFIAACTCVPVETSSLMSLTALANTILPTAPSTPSRASTKGTPAANMVAKVRAKRAMADFSIMGPIMVTLRIRRSNTSRIFRERFLKYENVYIVAKIPPKISHHHWARNRDIPTTIKVGPGNVAPKSANMASNCGTTNNNKILTTIAATTITATG